LKQKIASKSAETFSSESSILAHEMGAENEHFKKNFLSFPEIPK
jgi:hypothetical protein